MKVLTIGTDRKLFEEGSAVLARQIAYASKMEEFHIVVCTVSKGLTEKHIGNLFIYPTNSSSKFGFLMDAYKLGKKIIVQNKFIRGASVISGQDPFENGLMAYRLAKKFRLPIQLQLHTDCFSLYFQNSFLNRIRVKIARFLIPRAQGLRVVSDKIAQSLKQNFPNLKIVPQILPIFVDIQKIIDAPAETSLRQQFSQFNFIILMASRLTKEKEIGTALQVLASFVTDFPHTGLIIAGDGPEKKNLERLAQTLDISDHVVFVGWQENLIPYFKIANLFLLTSRYEGYGMILIEAGASGLPIITTDVGITGEIFQNGVNSFICPVGDVSCFSQRVKELISDNAKRELFKRRIQDSMKSIVIKEDEYTVKYVDILEKLL